MAVLKDGRAKLVAGSVSLDAKWFVVVRIVEGGVL